GHYRSGSNNNVERLGGIWMSHSYDDGETWEEPVTISVSNDPLLEPAVIYAAGAYRGLIRLNPANRYRELISYDGKEWRECVSDVGGGEGLPSPFLAADRYR